MSSFFGSFLGDDQADAARKAAADTYAKQQVATGQIKQYGDDYAKRFKELSAGYDPYVQTGYDANTGLDRLLTDPSSVRSLPGYQFDLTEGLNGVDRSSAARSGTQSGAHDKAVLRFATGLADDTLGKQFARLSGAANGGMTALGSQIGTEGTGLAGQLATRQSAYQGDYGSAGTIGQGEVAAATAKGAGVKNVIDLGMNLAKLGVGAYTGGFGGGGFGGGTPGAGSSPDMGGAGTGFDRYGRQFNYSGYA